MAPAVDAVRLAAIATGARRSRAARVSPSVSRNAACPATSPPVGTATTEVMPSLRAGAHSTESGLRPSHTRSAAATPASPCADVSFDAGTAPTSLRPSAVSALIRPGVTHFPLASTTRAPTGSGTLAPTAVMRPPSMTTVPFSIDRPGDGQDAAADDGDRLRRGAARQRDDGGGERQQDGRDRARHQRASAGTKPSSKSVRHRVSGADRSKRSAPSIQTFSARV